MTFKLLLQLIYFIFVLGIFYLFISLTYFRYIKPQQSILIGVLEYLDSNKDTKESKLNKITKEVYKAFKYLISEFTLKIKIDNYYRDLNLKINNHKFNY